MDKKRILIDFDGTLNSYTTPFDPKAPWSLPDPPLPGAIAFLQRLAAGEQYEPVVFSTRVLDKELGIDSERVCIAVRRWLAIHGLEQKTAARMTVTALKLPCALIIDDNAFRFEGRYPSPEQMTELTTSRRPK